MNLGERLRTLREERGYYQKKVSDDLSIKQNTLSGYEGNKRVPNAEMLDKIAKYYGVTIDYLMGSESSINELETVFPEGVKVLRRASKELTPEAKDQMIKLMRAFLEK